MSETKLVIKTQTFHPKDGADLLKILGQAKENSLTIKQYGGTYPATLDGAEVMISLDHMKRIVWYDPEEQTLTVEPGLMLEELLKRMEYLNYTLELYGTLPNMTVADAISVGLIGSSGSIAHCLKACQVVQAEGCLVEWTWPDYDQVSENVNGCFPSLQNLVCGLGMVGIITSATLTCIPLHFAQEVSYDCSVYDILERFPEMSESVYTHFHWFPLLNRVVVTKTLPVRIQQSFLQPFWKKWLEMICQGLYWLVNRIGPFLSWYFPSCSRPFSGAQLNLMLMTSAHRTHYCFRPQKFVSVSSYCRGIKWAFPADRLHSVMKEIEVWAEDNTAFCSTPVLISHQTHSKFRHPFLSPQAKDKTCTLWSDWFSTSSINLGYSAPMAEFEAILQNNGGLKCWSAGPIYASPLIGQMYPGYRHWCRVRSALDPCGTFKSAYVEGDLIADSGY
ncbi:L-gulonolactone oxidase [Anabrus simplex]|uniref:L-gulonolactone oxidase n=1 Tax=Anabrus simplex TaxID=316456 RepID=UPI0035A349DE